MEHILKDRITSFPKITANAVINARFTLLDFVCEIAFVKEQPHYRVLFGYSDSSTGINPIVSMEPAGEVGGRGKQIQATTRK